MPSQAASLELLAHAKGGNRDALEELSADTRTGSSAHRPEHVRAALPKIGECEPRGAKGLAHGGGG